MQHRLRLLLPVKLADRQLQLCAVRFLCVQRRSSKSPAEAAWPRPSAHSVSGFLQRVLDSHKLISLLNERVWDADTPTALKSADVKLSPYVVSQVIKLCMDLDTALEFYKWSMSMSMSRSVSVSVADSGCIDSHVYVSLMYRLGNAGRMEEMEAVAIECESKAMATVATFTVQLGAYKVARNLDGALRTWKRMEKFGIKPNMTSYITLLSTFSELKMYDEAADFYLLILWEKYLPDVRVITTMMQHLVLAGRMDSAMAIFKEMPSMKAKPNEVTYATLMKGYANLGNINAVLNLAQELKNVGLRPHRDAFKLLFEGMVSGERDEDCLKIMRELWPELSEQDLKGLISFYKGVSKKSGLDMRDDVDSLSEASDISDDDEVIDNSSSDPLFTSLWQFTGFVRCLSPWNTTTVVALEHAKIKWNGHLVSEIMKRIKAVDVGWKFFNWVEGQQGFTHDKYTYMSMIRVLLTDGRFPIIKQLLLEAQTKQLGVSLHTYNKVLKICGIRREPEVALDVFDLIESARLKPDSLSYHNLIHVLYKCGRFWRAATILAEMEKAGFVPSASTYLHVISGFAEAGQMKYAKAYYSKMRRSGFEPSNQLLSAFIKGYYQIGSLDRAEQVFQQMRKDDMHPSPEVYDLMIKVFRRAGKKVELQYIEREKESLLPIKYVAKQRAFDKYLKFHQIFKESLVEYDDFQLHGTGEVALLT